MDGNETWFEDELVPIEAAVEEIFKSRNRPPEAREREALNKIGGVVRVDRPRWGELATEHRPLSSGQAARFKLVRLGFQFELSEEGRNSGARFIFARCSAYLWPGGDNQPQPTVYEVFPRDLYDGELREISLKLGPQIKLGPVEVSLAEMSTDFSVGIVEPSIVGWPGEQERAPFWELRPVSKSLLGVRHLWLVIETPKGCTGVRLAARVDAQIQMRLLGVIPVGPRCREWAERPTVLIS